MADTITPNSDTTPEPTATGEAKSHFAKAMDEAKAGAKARSMATKLSPPKGRPSAARPARSTGSE